MIHKKSGVLGLLTMADMGDVSIDTPKYSRAKGVSRGSTLKGKALRKRKKKNRQQRNSRRRNRK